MSAWPRACGRRQLPRGLRQLPGKRRRPWRHRVAEGLRSVLGGAKSFSIEYPCHSATRRWFLMTVTPLADDRRQGAVVMHLDITEQRQAKDDLRESERRFRDMLANVDLVSLMLDREARITYCNDYLLRLTGWLREEVIGEGWFERFVPPSGDSMKDVFAALLADLPSASHHESEILTRSGRSAAHPVAQHDPALGRGRRDRHGQHRRGHHGPKARPAASSGHGRPAPRPAGGGSGGHGGGEPGGKDRPAERPGGGAVRLSPGRARRAAGDQHHPGRHRGSARGRTRFGGGRARSAGCGRGSGSKGGGRTGARFRSRSC